MGLQQVILKDLVLEYQLVPNEVTFSKILKRADRLLLYTIHKHVKRRNIIKVSLRDLYHTAIVGLGRAVKTSPKEESPDKFIARIIAYVRLELDNDYWDKHKPHDDYEIPLESILLVDNNKEFERSTEYYLILDVLVKAVQENVVTLKQMQCYLLRKMKGLSYRKIAKQNGITTAAMRKKICLVEKKLLTWMKNKNTIL